MNPMRMVTEPRLNRSIMLWYGGKSRLLHWILPVLQPMVENATRYVEPYVGGGSVWFALHPNTAETILNDRDESLISFYRAVQSQAFGCAYHRLRAVPYAYRSYLQHHHHPCYQLWIHQTQGISGTMGANRGSWGRAFIPRYGVSTRVSYYLKSLATLPALHRRLQRVELHCTDALDIIRAYDSPATVFYLDPPYPRHTRISGAVYRVEADDAHHHALVETLLRVQGRVVLSGYPTPFYEPLERAGWKRIERAVTTTVSVSTRRVNPARARTEVLWISEPR